MLVFSSKLSVQRRGKFGSKCESYMTFGIASNSYKTTDDFRDFERTFP